MRFIPQKDGLLVLAPAKLNLALYVLGRRPDGYHIIKTLMTPITLFDRILFRIAEKDELVIEGAASLQQENNTIRRAISAFKRHFNVDVPPLSIRLEKRIPVGSGLGGGSSDAAATILALHHLLGVPQDTKKDIACALDVGSDVPFFLRCEPYWMGGIGDV
ncbi:MAG: 4-diphosphocytidyl-2C-methyl-D-erythritol kinase, partial [Planctomycetota bacterium]